MIERDYMKAWVLPEGAEYRRAVYERQRASGTQPLTDNPTVVEIREALAAHQPASVLEVGCGWGRILRELMIGAPYAILGCDVSIDMLSRPEAQGLPAFIWDITQPSVNGSDFVFDVLFCRAVMMYLTREQKAAAMRNMESIARRKVLVWEWRDVCRERQAVHHSDKFEYHPIEVKDE